MSTPTKNEPKPGVRTSEFWTSVIASTAGIGLVVYGAVQDKSEVMDIGLIMAGISIPAYAISRGIAKVGAKKDGAT